MTPSVPATADRDLEAPAYEPPAIAWEEDFEPVAQGTYCLEIEESDCQGGPHGN